MKPARSLRRAVPCAVTVAAVVSLVQPGRTAERPPSLKDFPPQPAIRQPRTTARTEARTAPRPSAEGVASGAVSPPATPRGMGVANVVVEGWGESEDDALRDAFRAAVRTVIGSIVSAMTVVDQDRLVLDRVVTYSDGFVDSYEILDTTYEAGHVHRRIRATVRKRDLGRYVRQELSSSNIDGRGLWPEVITKIERRESAVSLFQAILQRFPWNCVDLALEGRPAVLGTADGHAKLGPKLVLRVDAEKFRAEEERIDAALRGLAVASGTVTTKASKATGPPLARLEPIFRSSFLRGPAPDPLTDLSMTLGAVFTFDRAEGWPPRKLAELPDKSGLLVFLGNGRQWNWYLIQETLVVPRSPKVAWVEFQDPAARTVTRRGVGLGPQAPGLSLAETTVHGRRLTTVFISPYFLDHAADGYVITRLAACSTVSISGEMRLSVDQIAEISSVTARLGE